MVLPRNEATQKGPALLTKRTAQSQAFLVASATKAALPFPGEFEHRIAASEVKWSIPSRWYAFSQPASVAIGPRQPCVFDPAW